MIKKTNMRKIIFIATIILINTINVSYSQTGTSSPREIAKSAFLSTVLLTMEDVNGQPLSLGSGFVIDDGVVVTNFHVIENSKGGIVKIIGDPKKYRISGIIEIDKQNDIAILSVKGLIAPKVKIGDYTTVGVGDNIYAVGNPRGLEGTFSQGIVSGIRDFEGEKLLQITAPISPGSSGGPILNANGEVIGVAIATIQNGQNLNFAIPITYVSSIYDKSTKTTKEFSDNVKNTTTSKRAIGESISEEVKGVLFQWESPAILSWFSFSIKNNLDYEIKNVSFIVIFYDVNKQPIDVFNSKTDIIIPSMLAKRTSVLNKESTSSTLYKLTKSVEIRILDFEIVE